MLLVGSRSLSTHVKLDREPDDWDLYMHLAEFQALKNVPHRNIGPQRYHLFADKTVIEVHVVMPGDTTSDAELLAIAENNNYPQVETPIGPAYNACLHMHKLLKLSSYGILNKSKNYRDLAVLKDIEVLWPEILVKRIEETVKRQESKDFFERYAVRRFVDHDQLHLWLAEALDISKPTFDKVVAGAVQVTPELFFGATQWDREACLVEEAIVLGIERWYLHAIKKSNAFDLWKNFLKAEKSSDPAQRWLERLCSPGVVKDHPEWIAKWAEENYAAIRERLQTSLLQIQDKMPKEFWTLVSNIKSGKIDTI